MEELKKIKQAKQKQTPENKINQLHDLIQSYLTSCKRKKVDSMYPIVQQAKLDMENKYKELDQLNSQELSQQQLEKLEENKKMLTNKLIELAKKVEQVKSSIQQMKIQKQQMQKETRRNYLRQSQLYDKLKKQGKLDSGKALPKIYGLGRDSRQKNMQKKSLDSMLGLSQTERSERKFDSGRDDFYNNLTYKRYKELEKLLDQIITQSPIIKLQKYLVDNKQNFNVKKVFKNFGIQQYFDNIIKNKKVYNMLLKIQNQ